MQGRRTGGSSGQPDGQNNQMEEYSEGEEGDEIIDHNDVDVDELEDDLGEEDDDESNGRLLNRQTDNMADINQQMMMGMEDDGDASLDQFQEQLANIDQKQQVYQQQMKNQQLDDFEDDMDGKQGNDFEDEDQHHSDNELDDMIDPDQQNIEDLDQLEKRLQMDEMDEDEDDDQFCDQRNSSPGDDDQMDDMDDDEFDEIDPEIYEAAQELGLDDDKIRELQ